MYHSPYNQKVQTVIVTIAGEFNLFRVNKS